MPPQSQKNCQKDAMGHISINPFIGRHRDSKAAIYSPNLCSAICRGILKEMKRRQGGLMPLMKISAAEPRTKIPDKEDFHDKKPEL